ncbi:magnesium transporter MgtE N-terminal domain-containing protein [Aestuariispira ectoiniformans]|uniref:magnesium transporter MgtE N-terminal domain-containing protein n=1 Tax=Aestuariispira ectoiniformans TaxID=2775080 RepID=UPI00223A89A5|nr:hypothetical protein [Aestuariispira ectoiniformans]
MFRFRIFSILIFATALMLSIKVGVIWRDVSEVAGKAQPDQALIVANTAKAQEKTPPAPSDAPAMDAPSALPEAGAVPENMTPAPTVETDDPLAGGDFSDMSSGEIRLLHDLAGRREELDKRERRLQEREALLRSVEQQLIGRQKELNKIKAEIDDMLKVYQGEQEGEARKLVNIYSNMKPKAAAAIFNDMDMDTLLAVLRGMKERKIAPIMAQMNPEKARLVTRELADIKNLPELPQ